MKNEQLIKYKNPVLLKDQEGKVKQTTFDLPPGDHTYGKKIVDDPEPIKHVVNGWKQMGTSDKPPSKLKNFQELNRQAIHNQVHTAKQQKDFRQTRNIMVDVRQGQKVIPIMLPEEQFTYGVPNRPSTPMKLVMGNCYALEADQKNQQLYASQTQKGEANKDKKLAAKKTKSQALREEAAKKEKSYQNKSNIQEQFKLNKYTSMGVTKVNTGLQKVPKQS